MGQKSGEMGVCSCERWGGGVKESRPWSNAKIRFECFSPITYASHAYMFCSLFLQFSRVRPCKVLYIYYYNIMVSGCPISKSRPCTCSGVSFRIGKNRYRWPLTSDRVFAHHRGVHVHFKLGELMAAAVLHIIDWPYFSDDRQRVNLLVCTVTRAKRWSNISVLPTTYRTKLYNEQVQNTSVVLYCPQENSLIKWNVKFSRIS